MAEPIFVSKCGQATIYLGSCQDVSIPMDAVVVTDPPYNIGKPQLIGKFKSRKTGKIQETIGNDFGGAFDTSSIDPMMWAHLMPNTVLSFYGAKRMGYLLRAFKKANFEVVQDFHWCKKNSPPPLRGVGFAWGVESGYIFRRKDTKHQPNKKAGYSPNFFVSGLCQGLERKSKEHFTQKPIQVFRWLIHFLTVPEDTVIDPFMGSGTTGIAAISLGRKFIGIENNEQYCQIAIRRIKNALVKRQTSFKV